MERDELKERLTKIKYDAYNIKLEDDIMEYADAMLYYIGDVDPVLRDELIYEVFCNWIAEKNYFTDEQLLYMLSKAMDDEHLFFNIGSEGDDSVFTRTFSVLLIDLLLYKNTINEYLDNEMFIKVKNNAIKYYTKEQDFRGYVDVKGWAHAAAHGADVFGTIAESKDYTEEIGMEILQALSHPLQNGKYFLSNEEDERIAVVVMILIMSNLLPDEKVFAWLDSLTTSKERPQNLFVDLHRSLYIDRVNSKNFVRSLYFSLIRQDDTEDILAKLLEVEAKLNSFVQ